MYTCRACYFLAGSMTDELVVEELAGLIRASQSEMTFQQAVDRAHNNGFVEMQGVKANVGTRS